MPKRKHKDKTRHLEKKIRRLESRLDRYSSSYSTSDEDDWDYERYYPETDGDPHYGHPESDHEEDILPLSDSEYSITGTTLKSVVDVPTPKIAPTPNVIPPNNNASQSVPKNTGDGVGTSNESSAALPADILEALGDPKAKEEVYGPKIPEEISKRWGRVLVDGLEKEIKQKLPEKHLIPDNFRLAKAPLLNPEITTVLTEAARNRDKLLEKSQNQLGLGIAELTNLTSAIIKEDLNKIEILKKISDISQIFLDLHYEDTKRRRKLIALCLNKKFAMMISNVKRDTYLFGENLGEKIKASKTAEQSGLQVKRKDAIASTSKKYPVQENWRGPPRTHIQRPRGQGGLRGRYTHQQSRRLPLVPDRQPRPTRKTTTKTTKP